jgi:hypothetical protein
MRSTEPRLKREFFAATHWAIQALQIRIHGSNRNEQVEELFRMIAEYPSQGFHRYFRAGNTITQGS